MGVLGQVFVGRARATGGVCLSADAFDASSDSPIESQSEEKQKSACTHMFIHVFVPVLSSSVFPLSLFTCPLHYM